MVMNFTNLTNANNPVEWLQYINSITDHYFGQVLLLSIFLFLMILFGSYGSIRTGLTVSLFLTSILSLLFSGLGILSPVIVVISIFSLVVSLIVNYNTID